MGRWPEVAFGTFLRPNARPYLLADDEDANLVGMRLYGGGPFHRELKPAMSIAKKSHFVIRAGDVIYNKLFAWKGTFGLVPRSLDGMFVSDKFPTYELDRELVDERYLAWFFRHPSLWEQAQSMSTGSAALSKLTLNPPKFLLLTIPLPPLSEQRQVVARIEEVAGLVGKARGLREESAATSVAALGAARAALFPPSQESKVRDFVEFQTGYAFKSEWFIDAGIRLARNANVSHGKLDWSETVRIDESRRHEFSRFELKAGDILIALDRPLISSGVKVAWVQETDLPALLLQRVARAVFRDRELVPEYFFHWLRSPLFATAIDPGRSNGVPHISHKDIESIPFEKPGRNEQLRIINKIREIEQAAERLQRLQSDSSPAFDALLPAVLDRAFRGEM